MAFVQFVKGQNWGDNYSVIAPDNSWSVVKKVLKGGLSDGLEVLEVNTPGKLDLDILYKNREKIKDRFIRNMISQSTEDSRSLWQNFISDNGLSSHMFVVCQRPFVS